MRRSKAVNPSSVAGADAGSAGKLELGKARGAEVEAKAGIKAS